MLQPICRESPNVAYAAPMRRENRLRKRADFLRLRREGRFFRSALCLLACHPNDLPHNRYGVVTSKRLGNAVTRNRTRRRLREAVRLMDHELRQGQDVLLIALEASVAASYWDLCAALRDLLGQAGLLQGNEEGELC